MMTVRVRVTGRQKAGKAKPHPHVQVLSAAGSVLLGATDQEVVYDGLGSDWQMIPRPGTNALARRAGRNRLQARVKAMLIHGFDGMSVEEQLLALDLIAASSALCGVSYAEMANHRWHLTRVELSTIDREPVTNRALHADVTLTFLVAVDEKLTSRARKGGGSGANDDKKGGGKRQSTVIVRTGDTLAKIAARVYGDADRWPEIAKLNDIRRPKSIRPGQKLKV